MLKARTKNLTRTQTIFYMASMYCYPQEEDIGSRTSKLIDLNSIWSLGQLSYFIAGFRMRVVEGECRGKGAFY